MFLDIGGGAFFLDALLTGLRAAAEPTRLRVLALLSHGELAVSELTHILGQSQPRVSRHLKLLCDAGLLDRFPEGAWVFYRLCANGDGAKITHSLLKLLPQNDTTLSLDAQRLDAIRAARAEKSAKYFDAHAQGWDELNSSQINRKAVEQTLKRIVSGFKASDLVDMGTGTGQALTALAECVAQAVGFDQSREMLAVARARLEQAGLTHCMVRQGDISQLPLADQSTDCVIIHQVLHYMPEPAKVIDEAHRILRPGGHLLVADYAPHTEEILRDQHAHRRLGFQDQEVQGWFQAAGLQIGTTTPITGPRLTVMIWTASKPT